DKPLLPEAFDQVKEGLDWAGVEYDEVLYKSDRIPLHYEWAEKLLATGEAYVCECDAETLRKNREAMRACVHRIQDVDETIAMEDLMETRIWDILQVKRRPRFVHFGILRFKDLELSKSRYRKEIAAGRLTGIDDPRTWSLQSLRRRGIRPAALREFVLSFGLS